MVFRRGAISAVAAVGAVMCGAVVGMASPASADTLSGTYTATVSSDSGATMTQTWQFAPCGPDCAQLSIPGATPATRPMHLEGTTWTWSGAEQCRTTVDAVSLSGSTGCGAFTFPVQLTPGG